MFGTVRLQTLVAALDRVSPGLSVFRSSGLELAVRPSATPRCRVFSSINSALNFSVEVFLCFFFFSLSEPHYKSSEGLG